MRTPPLPPSEINGSRKVEVIVKQKGHQWKKSKAEAFHNIGNAHMKEKQYAKAVDSYKKSLLNNPNDDFKILR